MTETLEAAGVIAGRYRIERVIGRGAMGEVLEVSDATSGNRLALKRPRARSEPNARSDRPSPANPNPAHFASLLRHEYLILSQLAHPNVVAVYDLGIDQRMPYYTMELLHGQHPGSGGKLEWRDVCRMLVTLCEPLALLHSRRLVHRDLSPRNVFVGEGGTAKLIDFGAMASMGAHHRPMGTPSCMAPEVWRREQLDGRTDIYGLGALGYCALTGQHAYPGRTLTQLPMAWQTPPAAPSELVPGVPHALDQLILSMLSLERHGRPLSVAEVIQRVLAIAELDLERNWVAPPEALATPVLVGRDKQLALITEFIGRTQKGRGQTCIVRGRSGSGRTRLLEAISHDAQEAGMHVVRASAGTLESAPFSLLRELTQALHLLDAERASLPPDSDLSSAYTLLAGDEPIGTIDEATSVALQRAFLDTSERLCAAKPLCIAVDDLERADAISTRVLAQLARRASNLPILLAFATAADDRAESAAPLAALLRQAVWLETTPLDSADNEAMVRSVFGDVPNVPRVARWAHRHALGEPSACMTLLEYLVSSGAARFVAGSWELPEDIDSLQLPAKVADKLELALPQGTPGRSLLEVVSLVTQPFPLELSAYVAALPEGRGASALDELVRAQRVLATSQGYVMRDYASLRWARDRLTPDSSAELHRALARVYATHGEPQAIQLAYHQWQAGDQDAADQTMRRLQEVFAYGLRDLVWRPNGLAVPAAFLEELLAYRKERNASPSDLYALRGALLAVALMSDTSMVRYAAETLEQLRHDVGLDLWSETDASLEPLERVFACVAKARRRAQPSSESERGLPPERALTELVRCIGLLGSPCAFIQDSALIRTLSELMAPLADLSPTSRMIADSTNIAYNSLVFGDRCIDQMRSLLAASAPAGNADIDPIARDTAHHLTAYYLALELASEGSAEALALADQLERQPIYEVLALQVRRTHALGRGRFDDAQRFRRRRELLALRTQGSDNHVRFTLLHELHAAFRCSDMLELSRVSTAMEERAAEYPGWRPWAALARSYLHLRADEPTTAVEIIEKALEPLPPFSHTSWHKLMAALAEAKNELREYARARDIASMTLEGARGLGISIDTEPRLRAALALAEAGLGDPKRGAQEISELLDELQNRIDPKSVITGMVRETASQIALLAKDYNGFSAHLDILGDQYGHHPGLRARHARWVRKGKERFRKLLVVLEKANAVKDWTARIASQLAERTGEDGSEYLLSFVLDELKIDAGQLYRVDADRKFSRLASRPDTEEPQLLSAAIQSFERWYKYDEEQTADEESETAIMQDSQGRSYIPLWLTRPGRAEEVSGLILLNCGPDRLAKLTPAFVKALAVHLDALT